MNEISYDYEKLKGLVSYKEIDLKLYGVIDSTNLEARRLAAKENSSPIALIANGQTAGKGRIGRGFYSPANTGIYLSLLLPDKNDPKDSVFITSAAAVAIRRAILTVTGISVGIKWVNDLYLEEKKICGILAERIFVGNQAFVIIGVGINLCTADFPKELKSKAGSLGVGAELRERLAAECVNQLYSAWFTPDAGRLMAEYRRSSVILGKKIIYTENGVSCIGIAERIDDNGHLYVRDGNGELFTLSSGEISLKLE